MPGLGLGLSLSTSSVGMRRLVGSACRLPDLARGSSEKQERAAWCAGRARPGPQAWGALRTAAASLEPLRHALPGCSPPCGPEPVGAASRPARSPAHGGVEEAGTRRGPRRLATVRDGGSFSRPPAQASCVRSSSCATSTARSGPARPSASSTTSSSSPWPGGWLTRRWRGGSWRPSASSTWPWAPSGEGRLCGPGGGGKDAGPPSPGRLSSEAVFFPSTRHVLSWQAGGSSQLTLGTREAHDMVSFSLHWHTSPGQADRVLRAVLPAAVASVS